MTNIEGNIASIPTITPQPGYALCEPYKEDHAFLIADSLKDKDTAGKIVAIGGPAINAYGNKVETDVKVGDIIVFEAYYSTMYNHHGKTLRFVKFDGIQGVINDGN